MRASCASCPRTSGPGLLQATILFSIFAGVLWTLSSGFTVRFHDRDYEIPGFMLWAAVTYAVLGSLLSYWVGRSLINRNSERYAREADLRFSLVRINEHLDGISLAAGEEDERRRVEMHLDNVLAATRRLVRGLTNLTWVTAGFGWITIVAPILVAAPLYFSGKISFGGMMQAAAAFTQAQSSLRWFVDNFSIIADWRATLQTGGELPLRPVYNRGHERARKPHHLCGGGAGHDHHRRSRDRVPGRFRHAQGDQGRHQGGRARAHCGRTRHRQDPAVPGTGGTMALGRRHHRAAENEEMLYLPTGTPYLPRGSLKEVLAYPLETEKFPEDAFARSLNRLGLDRLVPLLNETRRWDRELSQDEQLSLALARIVMQAPPWLLIDDMLGGLDDQAMERVVDIFSRELEHTSIIHIGRAAQARDPLFHRVLHLVPSPVALTAIPGGKAAAMKAFLFLLVCLLGSPFAFAQNFDFKPPASANDPSVPKVMRDLAERILPVYQENDQDKYLHNLSGLQLVAGNYPAAWQTRVQLRDRRKNADAHRPVGRSVVYDIYAYARAREAEDKGAFTKTYGVAYRAIVSALSGTDAFLLSELPGCTGCAAQGFGATRV